MFCFKFFESLENCFMIYEILCIKYFVVVIIIILKVINIKMEKVIYNDNLICG